MVGYSLSNCWISQSVKEKEEQKSNISNEEIGINFNWFSIFFVNDQCFIKAFFNRETEKCILQQKNWKTET